MFERILVVIASVSILLSFAGCGVKERLDLPNNLHNKIEFVSDSGETPYILYCYEKYNLDFIGLFTLKSKESDIMLSWNGQRMWYLDVYYSYTEKDPLFIYESNNVYLRSDYDYKMDTFIFDENEALFSDMFTPTSFVYDSSKEYEKKEEKILKSKTASRLQIEFTVFCEDGIWYAVRQTEELMYRISDGYMGDDNQG